MPKRMRGDEDMCDEDMRGAPGAEAEPLHKQHRGPNQQIIQHGNFFNKDVLMNNNNERIPNGVNKKKNLKQMLIGNNLHLYADVEMASHPSVVNVCAMCKIHMSESEAACNYCEVSQCCSCAMVCSVCSLPTCTKCSINSFAGHDRVFCLSCCR
ncbi:uncharacterized protein LOC143911829 [Arctopsyche grandis]|uniref:uncharacterized protein LOC143911829 n=1 Tax=Arctopsyche grandis TaxID=121162 RepID=UPI00406D9303